jgi:short-subunit dehydrogenase
MDLKDATVLITGASSGIGAELARLFASRARALVLVARRRPRLEALRDELVARHAGLAVRVEPCDLGDLGEIAQLVERVGQPVDVLVNCAGFGDLSPFDRADWHKIEQMIRLNVLGTAYLTHRLVGPMVARGRGGLLNIGSGFGLVFAPGMGAYIATKYFMNGLSESLRVDLAGTGVTVTQVCPGPVATEFESNVGNFTGLKVPGAVEISAERCARAAVRGFERGRARVVPGLLVRFLIWLGVVTPRLILRLFWYPFSRALRKKQLKAA